MRKITLSLFLLLIINLGFSQDILRIELLTDAYPGENAWAVFDSSGTLVAQNGVLTSETLVATDIVVSSTECYHFVIVDSPYADGIAGYNGSAPGYLNILYNGTNIGGFNTANSNFGGRLDIYGLGNGCANVDANLRRITNVPFSGLGDVDVSCSVQNSGLNNLTSFDINYQIDNSGTIITQNVTGVNMAIGDSNNYTFTTPWTINSSGSYNLRVWVSNPNGTTDGKTNNDSKDIDFSVASQNIQRLPLYEEFTSSTCGPCAGFNTNSFNTAFLTTNIGNYSLIKYQMNWPSPGDNYYTLEGGSRKDYYNVTGVPTLVFDGDAKNPDFFQNPSLLQPELTAHVSKPAFMAMTAIHAFRTVTNTVDIEVDIDPYVSGDYIVYAAVVEGTTVGNVGSNGETSFTNVMMKMVPDANGTTVSFTDGVHQNVNLSTTLSGTNIEEMSDLKVVVYIQHNGSGIVMQSANSVVDNTASVQQSTINSVYFYPNPSTGIVKVKTDKSIQVEIFDTMGRKVYENKNILNNSTMNLSNLDKGMYLVNLFDGEQLSTKKLILK